MDLNTMDAMINRIGETVVFGKDPFTEDPLSWTIVDCMEPGGITLMCNKEYERMEFDAPEPNNLTAIYPGSTAGRNINGNNNYKRSNIRQWLNSVHIANKWWLPTHPYDAEPSYANMNGFLYRFTPDDLDHILVSTVISVVPDMDITRSSSAIDTLYDRVWLPAHSQIFSWMEEYSDIYEDRQFDYFKNPKTRPTDFRGLLRTPDIHCPFSNRLAYPSSKTTRPYEYSCVACDPFATVRPCINVKWGTI